MYELIHYLWKEIAPRVEGPAGQGGKNAANVELAWHFYACCEPCVASASAGDSERWARLRLKQATEKKTCKADIGEDTFTRRRELIYLIYLLLTFVLVDTFLSYSLAKHGEGEPFLSPPLPSRQAGRKRQRETLHITSSVSGSCSVWTMSLCPRCRPSQRRDSEWNMEGGKSLSGICQLNVSLWWMGFLDVATMDCANRGSPSTWWHYCSVLFNKDRATTELSRVINTQLNPLIYVHFQVFIEVKVPHIWCINKLCVSELLKGQYVGF